MGTRPAPRRREVEPARVEIGEMPSRAGDVEGAEALPALGGWFDDDGCEWAGSEHLELKVWQQAQPEERAPPRHRAASGDDDGVDEHEHEHERAYGKSSVDLDLTEDAEQDDADGDGGIRSDFDGEDRDGEDSDGDDGDGDDRGW